MAFIQQHPIAILARVRSETPAFWRFMWSSFARDNCLFAAGALSYTSLLSLVPLMALTFSVLAAFPVFESVTVDLQNFVFENFVPAAGEVVSEHLNGFAQKASQLTAAGIVFLVVTAVMLMSNIDRALNAIWKVRNKRSAMASFMVYWAVLTLGPLLMGAGMVMSSFLISAPFLSDAAEAVVGKERLLSMLPFVAESLAFALLYMIVPNRPVGRRHAFFGGLVAAILFEAAKHAFAWYVTSFPTYEAIYGALAAVPIFLIWIFLSWVVVLLGAEFTYSLSAYRRAGEGDASGNVLRTAYRVSGVLWLAQKDGETRTVDELVAAVGGEDGQVMAVLEHLQNHKVVLRDAEGSWALARDMDRFSLFDLYKVCDANAVSLDNLVAGDDWDQAMGVALRSVDETMSEVMGKPLSHFYHGEKP